MKSVNPYLNFKGNAEQAFDYYKTVFGGEFMMVVRFRDFGGNGMGVAEKDLDKIAHIALPLGSDHVLMATDCVGSMGKTFNAGNNYYITIEADSDEEAGRLFNALSNGGNVEMPLQRTEWAEKYGVCADRFGVQWMVSYTGEARFQPGS